MTDIRKAAQQALEALERGETKLRWAAIPALKQALAEPDSDYERGFVDGMNMQTKGSVDKAVNRMAQTTHWEGCEAVHPECKERVMDRELIIRLARRAGAVFPSDGSWHKFETEGSLERFAALVAKEERKRICDMLLDMHAKEERHNYYLFIANIIKESA